MTARFTSSGTRIRLWGGVALVIGNMLFLVNNLDELSLSLLSRWMPDLISGEDVLLIAFGQLCLIFGYLAFYRHYLNRIDGSSLSALRLFCGGGMLLAVGHISFMSGPGIPLQTEFLFVFVIAGLLTLLVGLLWFGVANLRRPVLGRWPWLPLATGLFGLVAFVFLGGEVPKPGFQELRALFALGLAGLGVALWLDGSAPLNASVA